MARIAPTPKGRRTREQLLAAARATFEERGYFGTAVAEIVGRAGVSHGLFYKHFNSKNDILRALVDEMVEELFEASSESVGSHPTPFATLEATIRQFMHAYRDRAAMIRILEQAVAFSDEFLAVRLEIRARFGKRIEQAIRLQQEHGQLDPHLDPHMASYALGGMVDDFARGCYVLKQLIDEEAAITTLTTIWARAVGIPVDPVDERPRRPARSTRTPRKR